MDADEAVEQLVATSGDRLLRLAYQLTHDRAAAEDVVQDALTQLLRTWRRRSPELVSAEAYARRAVVTAHLARRRLRSSGETATGSVPDGRQAGFDADVVEQDRVWRALATLPVRQRTVLVLRYYEDLPDREIAALIGAREATVRSLVLRAFDTLRAGALAVEKQTEESR